MQQAVAEPSAAVRRRRAGREDAGVTGEAGPPVQERVHKSVKVWGLYLDMEESLGSLHTTKAAYEQCLKLRIATPQMLLNYAAYLEEKTYFEDAFQVYEKGVQLFKYPHVRPVWAAYLGKFLARYGGTKLERARDMFEQALEGAPAEHCAELYLKYGKLEEEHGLVRRAMAVYDRATGAVSAEHRYVPLHYSSSCYYSHY